MSGSHPQSGGVTLRRKIFDVIDRVSKSHLTIYAGNAAFFLLLSVLPFATFLLGIVRYLPISNEDLLNLIGRLLPEAAVPLFQYLFDMNNPIAVISISAVVAIWSASRGTYGVLRGLNRAYELKETRGYIRVRLQCMMDTLLLVIAFLAALLLYVFGRSITDFLQSGPFSFLINPVTRFLLATLMLILLFSLIYLILPNHRVRFSSVLPGAALAGAGWMAYSALYSLYINYFSSMNRLYGGLSTVAITMLWLYVCMEILFLGGLINHTLMEEK